MNLKKTSAIALLLIAIFAVSLIALPAANAHTPKWELTTNAYIAAFPNPVGVGQSTLIYMWLNRVYGQGAETSPPAYAAVSNTYRFRNYNLTIMDSDGAKVLEKIFDVIWDTTSSQSYYWTPDKVGTYTLIFTFPGQVYGAGGNGLPTSVLVNDTYLPSSATTKLTVQENPIPRYPSSYPLPTEYWTRPIYGENPDWWAISSNWLGTGAPGYGGFTVSYNLGGNGAVFYAGDTVGPLTGHIMWTKPMQTGGIVGGNKFEIQGNQYFEGSAYNQRYQNPIVVNGKIYYTDVVSFTGYASGPTNCLDLRTGELLWSRKDVPPLSFALIWDHEDPNQHGVYPAILATANFAQLFDADTGEPLFNVTGVPTTFTNALTTVLGPNGEQLKYVFINRGTPSSPNWVLAQWNSTNLWNFGVNPYTGGSLLSPSIINATALGARTTGATAGVVTDPSLQALITVFPPPLTGTTGTLSNSTSSATTSITVPYRSTLVVNGGVFDSSNPQDRYDWNVSIPWRNTMTSAPTIVGAIPGDIMLLYNGSLPSQGATFMGTLGFNPYTYFAINLNASKGQIGSILWMKTYNPPPGNLTVLEAGIDPVNRVFVENLRETQNFVGYDLDTGDKLWGPTTPQADLDYYGSQASGSLANTFAYGRLYSSAYAGILYCYDTKTGNLLFTYGNGGVPGNDTNSGFEVPGPYPTFVNAIGNDVVYLVTSEHTVETPVFKGAMTRAVNATDGTEIWTLSSYVTEFFTQSFAVADGFATWFNSYDNSIYTVGRGPSATTVSAPGAGLAFGQPLVITGTVMDISAGTKQKEQAARFPNGVPVISDASMTEWMGYVYQQKPRPTNATGVTVTLSVVDANNNCREIGTATTDMDGFFSFEWTPDIPGKYTVIATFAGTNGYWPSHAESAFTVMAEPEATPEPTPMPQSAADLYFVPAVVGIIIAIVVVGVAIILMQRKRP
ncbi:PQQ-binding-like beta-propeller repeat protein [Candidatus Bathyarchaeota archaeon A05DMB-2]|nr:PQQ-binding-like beta-propeller repeat protein [Candidatus Bathyarchaeota archaeon A05DMB-2]